MTTNDPVQNALFAVLRPARSLGPLVLGGALAAAMVADVLPDIKSAVWRSGGQDRVFQYLRLFVRRMLSRYLRELPLPPMADVDQEEQRHSAVCVLLPLVDFLHSLPPQSASVAEFEALDRQWRFERQWRRSGRPGSPMMEAMVVLEKANRLLGMDEGDVSIPYSLYPFKSLDDFASSAGDNLRSCWNPFDVGVVVKALNSGETHMLEKIQENLAGLD